MKKMLSLFLSVFLLLSLCSCGEKETVTSAPAAQSTAQRETAGFSQSETSAEPSSETTVAVQSTAFETKQTTSEPKNETTAITSSETVAETEPKTSEEKKTTAAAVTEKEGITCFVEIDCRNAKKNLSSLKKGKEAFVPKNGYILKKTAVNLPKGATAFDALKKACGENVCTDNCKYCQKNGIQLESSFTPAYQSYYVEGIHQLYEKDCGSLSGWMYSVDGVFPDVSSSAFELKGNETISFVYTASMGDDIG